MKRSLEFSAHVLPILLTPCTNRFMARARTKFYKELNQGKSYCNWGKEIGGAHAFLFDLVNRVGKILTKKSVRGLTRIMLPFRKSGGKLGRVAGTVMVALLLFAYVYRSSICFGQSSPTGPAYVFLTPAVHTVQRIGENFLVEAKVEDIIELQSCVFTIAYNTSLLNATHIARGNFFPQNATFNFEINETAGLVTINMSLLNPSPGLTGNGTLANVTFEVSTRAVESEIGLRTIRLTASGGESIECLLGGVLLFWWALDADPDEMGRQIDAYTEVGYFVRGDIVHLFANVTYNRWPVQSQLVGFQVQNGLGENYATLVAVTNEDGTAEVIFTIPQSYSSAGIWTAIGTAQLADRVIWDIVTFTVMSHLPHGPKADFTGSPNPTYRLTNVQFDASTSLPGWNGTNIAPITEYFWDFGDGNTTTTFTPFVNHTYQEPGIYYVTLTVYAPDATPQTDSTTRRITVLPLVVGGYTIAPEVVRESAQVAAPSLPEFASLTISLVLAGWKLRKKTWT